MKLNELFGEGAEAGNPYAKWEKELGMEPGELLRKKEANERRRADNFNKRTRSPRRFSSNLAPAKNPLSVSFEGLDEELTNEAKSLSLKLKAGHKFGTSDSGPPEKYTEQQLSRVADMLAAAEKVSGAVGGEDLQKKVFALLPSDMKLEFNYAKWTYKPLAK